jgi:alkylhydroperoxidase family enzyme
VPRIEPVGDPSEGSSLSRVLARRPEIREAWTALSNEVRFAGLLAVDLKETVRASTAAGVGCEFCASVGEVPADPDPRTALAIAAAERIVADRGEVDDSLFRALREEFDEQEIVELLALICIVCIGGQTFGAVIGAEPASEAEAAAYRVRRAERVAAARAS